MNPIFRSPFLFLWLLAGTFLPSTYAQGENQMKDSQVVAIIDRISSAVALSDYAAAAQSTIRVHHELAKQLPRDSSPSTHYGKPDIANSNAELSILISSLRTSMMAKDYPTALQKASSLGLSLMRMQQAAGPLAMYDSQRKSFTTSSSIFEEASSARSAYLANKPVEARLHALRVIELKKNQKSPLSSDLYVHQAYTILGLLDLKDNDMQGAGEALLSSIRNMSDGSITNTMPNYILAQKLLDADHREVVGTYLQLCTQIPWRHPKSLELVTNLNRDFQNGSLKSFGTHGKIIH